MQSTGVDDKAKTRKSARLTFPPLVLVLVLLWLELCANDRERHLYQTLRLLYVRRITDHISF